MSVISEAPKKKQKQKQPSVNKKFGSGFYKTLSQKYLKSFDNMTSEEKVKAKDILNKIKELEEQKAQLEKQLKGVETKRTELDKENTNFEYSKYINMVESECSEFLKVVKKSKKYLFHGYRNISTDKPFMGKPRSDRKPKDSSETGQERMDDYLRSKGFEALRSNSIFCISSMITARGYSNYNEAYLIFPKNGFKYTWSRNHDDVVLNDEHDDISIIKEYKPKFKQIGKRIEKLTDSFDDKLNQMERLASDNPDNLKISKDLDRLYKLEGVIDYTFNSIAYHSFIDGYITTGFLEEVIEIFEFALASKKFKKLINEISIKNRQSILSVVNTIMKTSEKAIEKTREAAFYNFDDYKLTNKDLDEAMRKGHEVLIHGEYIAFPEKYIKVFNKAFGLKVYSSKYY